jgi:hypothetical protein
MDAKARTVDSVSEVLLNQTFAATAQAAEIGDREPFRRG